jgi:hypothetical protein
MSFPVAPPGAMMSIGFDSDRIILEKLRVNREVELARLALPVSPPDGRANKRAASLQSAIA